MFCLLPSDQVLPFCPFLQQDLGHLQDPRKQIIRTWFVKNVVHCAQRFQSVTAIRHNFMFFLCISNPSVPYLAFTMIQKYNLVINEFNLNSFGFRMLSQKVIWKGLLQ